MTPSYRRNPSTDSGSLVWKHHGDIRKASSSLCSTNSVNGFHFQGHLIVQHCQCSFSHYRCIPHHRIRNERKGEKVFSPAKSAPFELSFQKSHVTHLLASHGWDLSCMAIPRGKEGWEKILLEWSLLSMLWIRIDLKGTFKIHLKVGMDAWVSNYLSLTASIFPPMFIKPNMWLCSERKQIGGCLETGKRCRKGKYRVTWGILEGMMDMFTIFIITMFPSSKYIKYTRRECTMPNAFVSLNSYVEKPNPQCDGIWRWGL